MSIILKTPDAEHISRQEWQRRRASWLLTVFVWFGILVPDLHHVVGIACFCQPAHVVTASSSASQDHTHFGRQVATASGDCLLCDWVASATYTAGSVTQARCYCVPDTQKEPAIFRLAALCDRSPPCRIPRAPPVLSA